MVFGEARLSVVETIGRQGSTHKNPSAIAGWQLQLAICIEHCRRVLSIGRNAARIARQRTHGYDAHCQDDYQQKVSHHKISFEALSKIGSCRIVLLTWRRELDSLARRPNPSFLRGCGSPGSLSCSPLRLACRARRT